MVISIFSAKYTQLCGKTGRSSISPRLGCVPYAGVAERQLEAKGRKGLGRGRSHQQVDPGNSAPAFTGGK